MSLIYALILAPKLAFQENK